MTNRMGGWQAVGKAITARMAQLNINQAELARRADVSKPTISGLMHGAPRGETSEIKRRAVSIALDWTADSIDRVLRGAQPMDAATKRAEHPTNHLGAGPPVSRLAALEHLASQAVPQLAEVAVEVEANRQKIADLESRVGVLERRMSRRRGA